VQSAREAARRTACINNLKQLGLAVQSYLSNDGVAPISISMWSEGSKPAPGLNGKGWIVSILPQLEQMALFNAVNFNKQMWDPTNATVAKSIIPVLHCPNDQDSLTNSTNQYQFRDYGREVALTNYKGVLGHDMGCHNTNPCNGLFWRNDYQFAARWNRFPDGTSNTMMIGEDVPKYNNHSAWLYANGDYAACQVVLNFRGDPDAWGTAISFRSEHQGGANFCFADGSVKWISDSISLPIYQAIATRDGTMFNRVEPAIGANSY
jgi:prepilin-type processing-associated H-X9-DG protein